MSVVELLRSVEVIPLPAESSPHKIKMYHSELIDSLFGVKE